ncbi:MAG: LacI family DNA-binding transcriptional regulator [Armatimonadota bacterium]
MTSRQNNQRAVTLQDIANRCALSIFTVSSALRGDARVKSATAARVQAAADELGYDPSRNQAARRMALLRHGREMLHHVIAFYITNNMEDVPYYNRLFWGVLNALTEEGFALLLNKLPGAKGQPGPDLTPLFRQGDIDGIIVPKNPAYDPHLTALHRGAGGRALPLVSMVWPGDECSSVVADDEGGMYAATRHLLERGHRHILYLMQPSTNILSDRRLAGVHRALSEVGLSPDHHLHRMPGFPGWVDPVLFRTRLSGEQDGTDHPLTQWLREHPQVTAILAWNDGVALHAWHTLERAGWRIPEDISIIGFDDTDPMPDADGKNLLTSVHVPLREIGEESARLIVRRVKGDTPDDVQVTIPTTLVERYSTAPPKR